MNNIFKKILLMGLLTSTMLASFADRGVGKKTKARITLNVPTTGSLKTAIGMNLKTGLKYTGSLLAISQQEGRSLQSTTLITYQKGSSIYILPYKQKVIVPESKPGYTGIKVILKKN